jgi:hypothetical protein
MAYSMRVRLASAHFTGKLFLMDKSAVAMAR